MKCERCGESEASFHVKQTAGDTVRELHLCEKCARSEGITVDGPLALTDFLFGLEVKTERQAVRPETSCPECHMTGADFRKTSRLGCPSCYNTFADELRPLLDEMQKGACHVGKIPGWERLPAEIELRRKEMEHAVAAQDFERAARLRDNISSLTASVGPVTDVLETGSDNDCR